MLLRLACLAGLLLMSGPGFSQAELIFPLDTFRQVIRARADAVGSADTILTDIRVFTGRLLQISAYQNGAPVWDSTAYYVDDPLRLDRGDLIVEYRLPPVGADEFYEVSIAFRLNEEPILPEPENLRGDLGKGIKGGPEKKEIFWIDLLENYINITDTLEMELTIVLYGLIPGCLEVKCADGEPTFNRRPFIYAGIAGAALIGIGQIFDSRSDNVYGNYLNPKLNQSEADALYSNANRKHHAYLALTYAGTAVLVTDAVWWLVKELQFRRDRRRYRECCRGTVLQWRPVMEIPPSGSGAYTGLQVNINF